MKFVLWILKGLKCSFSTSISNHQKILRILLQICMGQYISDIILNILQGISLSIITELLLMFFKAKTEAQRD